MTRKKPYNPPNALKEMKQHEAESADSELPWWMPVDVDRRAAQTAVRMMSNVDAATLKMLHNGLPDKLTKKKQQELVSSLILGVAMSEDFRLELAKWSLMKPLEFAKLQVSLIPKNINVEADVKHRHVIVVPATTTTDDWNSAHSARKELAEGDWGTDLTDTPFAQAIDAEVFPSAD